MWEAIDLRELRVFVVLAEELHFGHTAQRLRLTPSRVSQSLRELEEKLGAQLVHRTSRRVRLTAFGEAFLGELAPAYERLTALLESTHAQAASLAGTLRLGLFSGPAGGSRLLDIVSAFEDGHPEARVEVVQLSWDQPLEQLRAGEVDLMASWLPLEQPDLVVGPTLSRHQRALAVSRDHPLANRAQISVEDLAGQRIARFGGWPPELSAAWLPAQTPSGRAIAGWPVQVGQRTTLGIAIRVARGEFAHLTVPAAGESTGGLDVTYLPVTGMRKLRSGLVWRRRSPDRRLREFIRVAREILHPKRNGGPASPAQPRSRNG